MEQFCFEQPPKSSPIETREQAEVITSPEEIRGQLEGSQEHYEEALAKLRKGDKDDLEYLQKMQENLVAWKNEFDIRFGTLKEENHLIHNDVLVRLAELSEVLEQVK